MDTEDELKHEGELRHEGEELKREVQMCCETNCPCCGENCFCMFVLPWLGFLGLSYAAGWISSLFVRDATIYWSEAVARPWWMPPQWIFPPVWTVLYFLLGTAVWLAWRKVGCQKASHVIALFVTLLILQMGWTYAFFYLQMPFGAFIDLIWAFAVLILLAMSIAPISKVGALLLLPQILWMIYALALNYSIWRMG